MKKATITIGIPAFNESQTIIMLLDSISRQIQDNYIIQKIIIFLDGTTDDTRKKLRSYHSLPIDVLTSNSRKGKAFGLNKIIQHCSSDILVLFDGDIVLRDAFTISQMINPILQNHADLTSPMIKELPNTDIVGNILTSSMEYKRELFSQIQHGNNIYTCHGRARAFSKKLYKTILFKSSLNEDAYSFMYCVANGYQYAYVPNVCIYYTLPQSIQDHEAQSLRFFQSKNLSIAEFGNEFIDRIYKIPATIALSVLIKHIIKNPLLLIYLFLVIAIKCKSYWKSPSKNTWQIATTSKVKS